MGSDVGEFVEKPFPSSFKVHHALCAELMKIINNVSSILPVIETARPRCSAGIQALCLLNRAVEKANLLLQQCSESSRLYLALTGDAIVARCERSRNMLEQSLGQLQNMVPVLLAVEISKLLDDLRSTTFVLDPSEEDAGKAVHDLILQGPSEPGSSENSELKALQFAASKLFITSPKSILVERRSIKKLLEKVGESDLKKKKILLYLSSLLKKYEKSIASGQAQSVCRENEGIYLMANTRHNSVYTETAEVAETPLPAHCDAQVDVSVDVILPEEFKCPLSSRLMYEPVVIASGETFERMWIQKWFDEGNTCCPKTKKKLAHQQWTPNTALKGLISQWCTSHGLEMLDPIILGGTVHPWDNSSTSIVSLGSSLNDLRLQVDLSNVSLGSLGNSNNSESSLQRFANAFELVTLHTKDTTKEDHSFRSVDEEYFDIFSKLTDLPWQSQCKVVEDLESNLKHSRQPLHSASTENFLEGLIRFLGKSRDLGDVKAQKTALQLLLTYLKKSRYEITHVHQDGFSMLASFLDSEVAEQAVAIVELLSAQPDCRQKVVNSGGIPSILETLDCEMRDLHMSALKILYNLCLSSDLRPYIIPCIPKLVRFLKDGESAKYALLIIKNLCGIEEARISITETHECIASVADLLETESNEEQEHAVAILLSLCSQRVQYCQLVLDEGLAVIPALVNISINGTERSKVCAMELLRLLRDANDGDGCDLSDLDPPTLGDPGYHHSSEMKPSSRASGFFGRKFSMFSRKPVSAAPRMKK